MGVIFVAILSILSSAASLEEGCEVSFICKKCTYELDPSYSFKVLPLKTDYHLRISAYGEDALQRNQLIVGEELFSLDLEQRSDHVMASMQLRNLSPVEISKFFHLQQNWTTFSFALSDHKLKFRVMTKENVTTSIDLTSWLNSQILDCLHLFQIISYRSSGVLQICSEPDNDSDRQLRHLRPEALYQVKSPINSSVLTIILAVMVAALSVLSIFLTVWVLSVRSELRKLRLASVSVLHLPKGEKEIYSHYVVDPTQHIYEAVDESLLEKLRATYLKMHLSSSDPMRCSSGGDCDKWYSGKTLKKETKEGSGTESSQEGASDCGTVHGYANVLS